MSEQNELAEAVAAAVNDLDTDEGAQAAHKREAKEKQQAPCACAYWGIEVDGGDEEGTGCQGGLTTKTFIRGHDSKLKALLIKAGEHAWFTDVEVIHYAGDMATRMSWGDAADQFGFAAQVHDAVEKRHAKLEEKAERAEARAKAKEKRDAEKAEAKAKRKLEAEAAADGDADGASETQEQREEDWDTGADWSDQDEQ